ncbi:MAG: putative capsid protein [Circoviridae sp.]|nr:MAG: putative capsid protein [Circoviridae sp.]
MPILRLPKNRKKLRIKGLSKNQVKSVKKIAKKVAMTLPEKKVFGYLDENRALLHNKTDYLGNFLGCKQGTADPNDIQGASDKLVRVGDEFYLRSINIRLWLSNKNDRPNVMYKCFLFWYDSDLASLNDATCWFTQQNKMLDRINNEQISIIDQKTIFSGSSYATGVSSVSGSAKEHSYLATLKGSWKSKKITYSNGGKTPKKRDIGMMVVCYDAYGTLQSDNIASYAYNAKIVIQDP